MNIELIRETDASHLNSIINDPSVYPFVRRVEDAPIDLSSLLADKRHVALMGQYGGCVFVQHQPGLYEAFAQVLDSHRGPWALEMSRKAARWMFTHTDAVEIMARCPKGNLGARSLALAVGATPEFVARHGWDQAGEIIPAMIFSLKIQDWMKRDSSLIAIGAAFWQSLGMELARVGKSLPLGGDQVHDRYIGAAVEMIRNGQFQKGLVFYNRFAALAHLPALRVDGLDPVTIVIGDVMLEMHGKSFFAVPDFGSSAVH